MPVLTHEPGKLGKKNLTAPAAIANTKPSCTKTQQQAFFRVLVYHVNQIQNSGMMVQIQHPPEQEIYLLREDLQKTLIKSDIHLSELSPFQRIILTTDGTLTEILQAYLLEEIKVVKLSEDIIYISEDLPDLDLSRGDQVIDRKICLQGKKSRKNWIYAESIIALKQLDQHFRDELIYSKKPIGKLWLENRVETFKEITDSRKEKANHLGDYFQVKSQDNLFSRTYRVLSQGKPVMRITEKFPEHFFS